MNRKGESDEDEKSNLLGLILSLVGLILVIFVIYKGILAITNDPEPENAHAALQRIITKINALDEKSSTNYTLQGYKQKNSEWYLIGWSKTQEGRPEKCFFESCICICAGSDASACQSKGECELLGNGPEVIIQTPFWGYVSERREGGPMPGSQSVAVNSGKTEKIRSYIKIPQNLISIEIVKGINSEGKPSISLKYYSQSYRDGTIESSNTGA